MNTYLDLLTKKLIEHWDLFNHNTKVNLLYDALKKKLKEDPEYELWVPLKYFKNNQGKLPIKVEHDFPDLLISSRGKVFDKARGFYYTGSLRKAGYIWIFIRGISISLHRAMACNFIPKPIRHRFVSLSTLVVNHMDAVKINNDLDNLEWVTDEENKEHARLNGLLNPLSGIDHQNIIPMLGTVVDIPDFNGEQFVVLGGRHGDSLGISHKVLHKHRNETYGIKTYKGCVWEEISKEDAEKFTLDLDNALVEAIKNYKFKRVGKENAGKQKWVYIATNKATGEIKEFIGSNALTEAGFIYPNVIKCITGNRKSHNGYTFEKKLIQ
jgi:hypothetical protein